MVKDSEESVDDKLVESHRRGRRLDEKLSNKNPDSVADFNRRADRRRENVSTANYYESRDGQESEKTTREE
jgi:hypothetical protein